MARDIRAVVHTRRAFPSPWGRPDEDGGEACGRAAKKRPETGGGSPHLPGEPWDDLLREVPV
jgi:hypothetical protein